MNRNLFSEQLLRGEKQAIETFVNENRTMVFRTCLAYVQNNEDAADLTQEVFIRAFEKLEQFKGEAKLSTWLLRIAINLSINYLRDNKKRLLNTDISDANHIENAESTMPRREIRLALRKAMFELTDDQRRVFIMSYNLELSYKEISDITGLSVSSVESLLFRARKKLRETLVNFYTYQKQ